jgi:hypothetical protein
VGNRGDGPCSLSAAEQLTGSDLANRKKGDIPLQKLEQGDEARSFYRRALAQHLQAGDICLAAQLLELKLHAPDEALVDLAGAWPDSPDASRCATTRGLWHPSLGSPGAACHRTQQTSQYLIYSMRQVQKVVVEPHEKAINLVRLGFGFLLGDLAETERMTFSVVDELAVPSFAFLINGGHCCTCWQPRRDTDQT